MDIIQEVRSFVENECKKPSSKYGYEPFINHFIPMVEFATQLSERMGGDREVITLAAWLHDIGSIINGRRDHHITGAKIAEEKLKEFNYPTQKIELIKKCIMNHRGSQNLERNSIEEQIIAEADVMCSFKNISGLFMAAFNYEGLGQEEARLSVLAKLERKWKQLESPESKELIRPRFEAAKIILNNKI